MGNGFSELLQQLDMFATVKYVTARGKTFGAEALAKYGIVFSSLLPPVTFMLKNQGSTARDYLAFERNFLTQCRFGLLLSLLSSSFLLSARIPTPNAPTGSYPHLPPNARLPLGYLFFIFGFSGICLALLQAVNTEAGFPASIQVTNDITGYGVGDDSRHLYLSFRQKVVKSDPVYQSSHEIGQA
ncbi:hypothetical protein BU17DRAFT_61840 [Hysterangium stoloniferum]|nr:hypothetical protein BU17DRAFT_61840 [Hysterangium stoloniferum]